MYVKSYTGVIGRVATATVTFKTECFEICNDISTSLYPAINYWTWDAVTADEAVFLVGYTIRDAATTFYLPSFTPTLASSRDFNAICGQMSYTFNDPDPYDYPNDIHDPEEPAEFLSVFSNFAPTGLVGATKPSFTAFSEDVYKADFVLPFIQEYSFTVSAQLVLYSVIQGNYPDTLDFKVGYPCIGASYSNVPHFLYYVDPVSRRL